MLASLDDPPSPWTPTLVQFTRVSFHAALHTHKLRPVIVSVKDEDGSPSRFRSESSTLQRRGCKAITPRGGKLDARARFKLACVGVAIRCLVVQPPRDEFKTLGEGRRIELRPEVHSGPLGFKPSCRPFRGTLRKSGDLEQFGRPSFMANDPIRGSRGRVGVRLYAVLEALPEDQSRKLLHVS
jgi:hypothetical protein